MLAFGLLRKNILMHIEVFRGKIMCLKLGFKIFQKKCGSVAKRMFSKLSESALCIWWPGYWSFSFGISPSNEYSELISLRMDWLDLLAIQGTLKGPTPQFKRINSSALSFLYSPTLTFHDRWKNHSLN